MNIEKSKMSRPLVSVVIPCFNAEQWVGEAIESCLNQTYSNLEIIIVDDGSTDGSVKVLDAFGSKIKLLTGANKGGNHARNQGFAVSSGEYVQFLDADDYLLPDKIEKQVLRLEETGADVAYGDWQRRHHLPNGTSRLGEVVATEVHEDVLEAIFNSRWRTNTNALLCKRDAVTNSGGWDEDLKAAQDIGFYIALALSGAKFVYQPGLLSVYRRYGNTTVSTSDSAKLTRNMCLLYEKTEREMRASGKLSPEYTRALATTFFSLARRSYAVDRELFRAMLDKNLALVPNFKPQVSAGYNLIQRIFGFENAEKFAYTRRLFIEKLKFPLSAINSHRSSKHSAN